MAVYKVASGVMPPGLRPHLADGKRLADFLGGHRRTNLGQQFRRRIESAQLPRRRLGGSFLDGAVFIVAPPVDLESVAFVAACLGIGGLRSFFVVLVVRRMVPSGWEK